MDGPTDVDHRQAHIGPEGIEGLTEGMPPPGFIGFRPEQTYEAVSSDSPLAVRGEDREETQVGWPETAGGRGARLLQGQSAKGKETQHRFGVCGSGLGVSSRPPRRNLQGQNDLTFP